MFDHLTGRLEMWHYFAPKDPSARDFNPPRVIEAGVEEIEVIVAGYGNFEFDGQIYEAGPGSNLWYWPGDRVVVTPCVSDPYETIVFRFGVKSGNKSSKPAPYTRWQSVAQCVEFCRNVLGLYREDGIDDAQEVGCYYARLVLEGIESQRRQTREDLPVSLKLAMQFIQHNFSYEISVNNIAAAAEISPPHLGLLFRTHFSTSPMQYVIRQRIVFAQEMLLRTNHSVKEICRVVGFNDLKYFCSRFKRQTSYRPTEYRQLFKHS